MTHQLNFDSRGGQIATLLAGSWRTSPPKLAVPPKGLDAIAPRLSNTGCGALAWWRLRHSDMSLPATASRLREAYLAQAVYAAEHECRVIETFGLLRSAGIEPILLKGWAIARLYPESGLRPSGDIDLCVAPNHRASAQSASRSYWVDFDHDEITRFGECDFQDLYDHSQLVKLDGYELRVLGPEDHLRLLCLHFLKHGAWRPLWLCDVAAAVEARAQTFDWDRCYGRNTRWAEWISCTLLLAQRLLEARLEDAPTRRGASELPSWLPHSVLKQWSTDYPRNLPTFANQITAERMSQNIVHTILQRWPNPIQATVDTNGQFNRRPRLPFQIRNVFHRSAKLCVQYVKRTPG
ncbi:MAG: nucleotidyltransferase family protein [Candidatus Sulfotelmatobacter sp.]